MKQAIIKDNQELGFLIIQDRDCFLVGYKGVKVTQLYQEVFNLLKTSFSVGATIGAVEDVKIGYRNNETQKYEITNIKPSHEVLSLNGNVGYKPNQVVFPHLHVSLSNEKCEVVGGHLIDATISITLESHLTIFPFTFNRELDSVTGLDLITGIL